MEKYSPIGVILYLRPISMYEALEYFNENKVFFIHIDNIGAIYIYRLWR
jgi:hypothetical protein